MDRKYELSFKINLQMFAGKEEEVEEIEETEEVEEVEETPKKKRTTRKKKTETVDLDAEKAKWIAEYEAKKEQEKINNETKTELEKIKSMLEKKPEDKKIEKDGKKENDTPNMIPREIYENEISQLQDSIKVLLKNAEVSEEREKFRVFERDLKKAIKDEPYLEETVDMYLENGIIKNMEDFEKIIAPQRERLKEANELKQKLAKYNGKNPDLDYIKEKKGTPIKNKETEDRYKDVPKNLLAQINKKLR